MPPNGNGSNLKKGWLIGILLTLIGALAGFIFNDVIIDGIAGNRIGVEEAKEMVREHVHNEFEQLFAGQAAIMRQQVMEHGFLIEGPLPPHLDPVVLNGLSERGATP